MADTNAGFELCRTKGFLYQALKLEPEMQSAVSCLKAPKCIFLRDQSALFLRLPNSAVINCHFSVLSRSPCSARSAAARIYKAQTRCRSCSRWRLVCTVTVARWQLMTHKSGQVKLPPLYTKCSTTTSKDYQRIDRNMLEMHLQAFSDFLRNLRRKEKERYSQPQGPQKTEKEESWTALWAQNCENGWNGASSQKHFTFECYY